MNCKNCGESLVQDAQYCHVCSAQVITQRITLKSLFAKFATDFFGLDNKYLVTAKDMFIAPEKVLNAYISGVRKRYLSPFTYLAIGTAIAMLVFNAYATDFETASLAYQEEQLEVMKSMFSNIEGFDMAKFDESIAKQQEDAKGATSKLLQYFNFYTFLLIPVYTLVAFLVFRKPHNYAEHLVINSYIQGTTFIIGTLIFVLSLLTSPGVYMTSFLLTMVYYTYVYTRLNQYKFSEVILKILRFVGLILVLFILIMGIGIIVGYLSAISE